MSVDIERAHVERTQVERTHVERAPESALEPPPSTALGRPTRSRPGRDRGDTATIGRTRRADRSEEARADRGDSPRLHMPERTEPLRDRPDGDGTPAPRLAAARYVDVGPLDPAILAPGAYERALDRLVDRLSRCATGDGTSRRARVILRSDRALLAQMRRDANGLISG